MEELCNMNPENEKYSSDLSVCYKILTSLYSESAELTKSLKYCQKSLTIWEKLYKRTPDSKLYLVGLAAALHDEAYFRLGDLDNALYYYMESYKKNEDLHKRNQILHANNLSDIGFSIGDIFLKWGETEKAIIYYQKSCDILEILCKVPNESQSQLPFSCTGYSRLGGAFLEIGKLQKANSSYLSAFSLAKKLYQLAPNDTPRACLLSNSYTKLGAFYLRMGNFTKSDENLKHLLHSGGAPSNIPDLHISKRFRDIYHHIGDLY